MKSLLTWAVLSLAIMAGFTARAEAAGEYDIYYTTNSKFIWCGTSAAADKWDIRVIAKSFDTLSQCNGSKEFKDLSKKYDSNSLTPPEYKPAKILSIESKPANDLRIEAYVKYFEKISKLKVDRNKIFFGKLQEAVGFCTYSNQQIIIDREYWYGKYSEYDKEMTIYHELGHCLLNRPHNDLIKKKFKNEKKLCHNSLMYPSALGHLDAYRCFHKHRDYYLKELLTKKRKIVLTINVYRYNYKLKKWETVRKIKNLTKKISSIEIGSNKCTLKRHGQKKSEDGWYSEVLNLECTKDYINYQMLWHQVWYSSSPDMWDNGYSYGTSKSSSIRFWDSILKQSYSISIKAEIK